MEKENLFMKVRTGACLVGIFYAFDDVDVDVSLFSFLSACWLTTKEHARGAMVVDCCVSDTLLFSFSHGVCFFQSPSDFAALLFCFSFS